MTVRELLANTARHARYEQALAARSPAAWSQNVASPRAIALFQLIVLAVVTWINMLSDSRTPFFVVPCIVGFHMVVYISNELLSPFAQQEILASPRHAIMLAHSWQHALSVIVMVVGVPLAIGLQDHYAIDGARELRWSGLFSVALWWPIAIAFACWVLLELRLPGGEHRLTICVGTGFGLALWATLAYLLAPQDVSRYGVAALLSDRWPTLFLYLAFLLWPLLLLVPALRRRVIVRMGAGFPRDFGITFVLVLLTLGIGATVFIALLRPGTILVAANSSNSSGAWSVFKLVLTVAGLTTLCLRVWHLIERVDMGNQALSSRQQKHRTMPASQRIRLRPLPVRAGGGLLRVATLMALSRFRNWPLPVLSWPFWILWEMRAIALGIIWTVVAWILWTSQDLLAIPWLGVLLLFIPSPLGLPASRRLLLLGADFRIQARHNMVWGLLLGALPALGGVAWCIAKLPPRTTHVTWQWTAILLATTFLIVRMTSAPGRRFLYEKIPGYWPMVILALAISTVFSFGQPTALAFAILLLIGAVILVVFRWNNPESSGEWERLAANDV